MIAMISKYSFYFGERIIHKFFNKLVIVFIIFFLSNCAIGPNHGAIYTDIRYPGEFNIDNQVLGSKSGQACQYMLFGLITVGDSSAGGIARKFGILRLATIDYRFRGIFYPVYGQFCTEVTGE
ncbi:TRL domain-containing protein [Leptospira sp. GIMC2001]|uniref:TRL domain-containing protein n=1 Tax=Leptospira sp. GIMC2001 TaxID=1513297 RepID=UPI00234B0606|nr:TRL domain-containing protein [Leptospira sp. GIMC2001]WCL47761.1 TRL-like family protein [Leptospira sp. GIMC2001]